MTKRHHKASDGKFHIHGHKYDRLIGSRAEVMHGTAYKTSGGLKKNELKYNKHGKIVSRAKSAKGKTLLKRLTDKGYHTRKGKFGYVKKSAKGRGSSHRRSRRHRTHKRRHTRHRRRHHRHPARRPARRHRTHIDEWRSASTGRFVTN